MNPVRKARIWQGIKRRIDCDAARDADRQRMAVHLGAGFLAGFGLALLLLGGD